MTEPNHWIALLGVMVGMVLLAFALTACTTHDLPPPLPSTVERPTFTSTVLSVTDGDTLTVFVNGRPLSGDGDTTESIGGRFSAILDYNENVMIAGFASALRGWDKRNIVNKDVGSQLPLIRAVGFPEQSKSGKEKAESPDSSPALWGGPPCGGPPWGRRLLIALIGFAMGFFICFIGFDYFDDEGSLLGAAIIGSGLLIVIGSLWLWGVTRYPWSWCLPI